jgi:hypothetical protein
MFVIILFTLIVGAMLIVLLQLRNSVNLCSTANLIKKQLRTDAIIAQWKKEQSELEEKRARKEHDEAFNSTHMGFVAKKLYSKRLVDEYTAQRDATCPDAPLALGMWLLAHPNCRVMCDVMMYHSHVKIGSVIAWRKDTVRGDLIMSYVIVRVNTPQRWIHVEVTHYERESREEILVEYLKTLDREMFEDTDLIRKTFPDGEECMLWDPSMEMLKTIE